MKNGPEASQRIWCANCMAYDMTRECYAAAYASGFNRTIRVLCSRGVTGESAEDFAQSAWTKGWEQINQLRDESLLLTWVNTIALNLYRAAVRRTPRFEPLGELPSPTGVNLAAIEVAKILGSTQLRDRELFQHCLQGFTAKDIARRHGVSDLAIRLRLLRARRDVCNRMKQFPRLRAIGAESAGNSGQPSRLAV